MLENALSNKVPPSHRTVTNQYTKHLLIEINGCWGDANNVVVKMVCSPRPDFRWSLAHWFVVLRLRLKKVFTKWRFDTVKGDRL